MSCSFLSEEIPGCNTCNSDEEKRYGFGKQAQIQIIIIFGNSIDKEKERGSTLRFVTIMETY
jgi:hypothetical protein